MANLFYLLLTKLYAYSILHCTKILSMQKRKNSRAVPHTHVHIDPKRSTFICTTGSGTAAATATPSIKKYSQPSPKIPSGIGYKTAL